MAKELKIGIALAGGGARGAAHIGVLQVLHNNNIPIHTVAGTSAGAVIGAMYAATLDPFWVEQRFREFLNSEAFHSMGTDRMSEKRNKTDSLFSQISKNVKDKLVVTLRMTRSGIIDRKKLVDSIDFLLPVKTFDDLKIPLKIIATDLNSGEDYLYSSGDLVEAVVQSSSIPGFVAPLEKNGQLLVDGGVSAPIPINSLSNSEIDFTIAVDIARREMRKLERFNILEIIARTEQITSVRLLNELVKKADFVISPNVKGAHWSEFGRIDEFLESGKQAAEEKLSDLKRELKHRTSWFYRLRQWVKQ